ncbi:Type I restriction enzyme (modification subunit) [Pseudoxanthomonas spadix BD-a59]|uniref:site-specific DNA-methyltransferase (adenine-specific) n=1 Tax=Pseudoxanthomonas spadix (strain BD-a59) TaxID=1045855 RepID=G7UQJ2_PSEUP|nr:N-6 DNA methylase [Pseudoxanthomonas spadix]AER56995.1 Type I restriction enzyme (modification subunit) [Pseudoxanthomonas spadix BD-a59]
MSAKVLWQLVDHFTATPLRGPDAILLSIQMLAWARLSARELVEPALRLERVQQRGTESLVQGLAELERPASPFALAFQGAVTAAANATARLQQVAEDAVRFEADGLLADFSPADVAFDVVSIQHYWPTIEPSLADLMVRLAGPLEGVTAYTAWDVTAQLADRLSRRGCNVMVENPVASPFPALVEIFSGQRIETSFSDPVRSPGFVSRGKLRQSDVAIALPPLGIKPEPGIVERDLLDRFDIPKATWAVLAVQHLLAQSRKRVVVAVPHSLLQGLGSERALRQQIVDSGRLQAVVSLPPGLVFGTAIQIAVLVLAPAGAADRVRFVDASGEDFRESASRTRTTLLNIDRIVDEAMTGERSPVARTISRAEIEANDYQLLVGRYVLAANQEKLRSKLAGARLAPLGDLVETVRPLSASANIADGLFSVREVGTADIPPVGYVSAGRELYAEPAAMNKGFDQFLRPGDIVLTIRGSTGKVGIVPDHVPNPGTGGWVAGSSATVLRAKSATPVDPKALFLLLRSSLGQDLLKTITSGSTIPMITLRDLSRLEVPLPSVASGRRAAEVLDAEDALQRQIENLTRQQSAVSGDDWAAGMLQ